MEKVIRELSDREKQVIQPEVEELAEAEARLEEAAGEVDRAKQRIGRMIHLMHEPASEDDEISLDLERMVLTREYAECVEDEG